MPERRSHRGQSRSLTDNVSADPQVSQSAGHGDAAPPTSQADSAACENGTGGRRYAGGNVVASPKPAVGVFTPGRNLSRAPSASLRDRLRRRWTEPDCRKVRQQSGSGEGSGQAVPRSVPWCTPGSGDDWAPRPGVGHDQKRRVERQGQSAWHSLGDSGQGAAHPGMAATEGRGGVRGNCRSIACSVNRFVNRTRRDSLRWGRRIRRSEMGSVLSAEVTAPARDGPRRQRRASYGS